MNRTQRKLKKDLRKIENGRSSFKKIYADCRSFDGEPKSYGSDIKDLQKQLKEARKRTREFQSQINRKEAAAA